LPLEVPVLEGMKDTKNTKDMKNMKEREKEVAVAAMEKEEGGGSGIMKETKDVIKSNLAGGSKRAKIRRNSSLLV